MYSGSGNFGRGHLVFNSGLVSFSGCRSSQLLIPHPDSLLLRAAKTKALK